MNNSLDVQKSIKHFPVVNKNRKLSRSDFLGRIGILMGGYSSEREISLKSGMAVFKALRDVGCQVQVLDIVVQRRDEIRDFIDNARIDIAFNALHGCLGEDGTIQGILESLDIPFTGSGVEASQRAINKVTTQKLFMRSEIPVVEHAVLVEGSGEPNFPFPWVVKSACEGSSIGIYIVSNYEEFTGAMARVWKYGPQVLIERYIDGRELTVGICDHQPLSIIEICSRRRFFDFTAKYNKGMTHYIVPAQISMELTRKIQDIALKAHQTLGCRDFSRVDFMLDKENCPYVLEVNTIPGFTETSLLPMAAREVGISFEALCLRLISLTLERSLKVMV